MYIIRKLISQVVFYKSPSKNTHLKFAPDESLMMKPYLRILSPIQYTKLLTSITLYYYCALDSILLCQKVVTNLICNQVPSNIQLPDNQFGPNNPDDITSMQVTKQPMRCQADDVGVPCVSNTTVVAHGREAHHLPFLPCQQHTKCL